MNDVNDNESNLTPTPDDVTNSPTEEHTDVKVEESLETTSKGQINRTPNYAEFLRILEHTHLPDEKLDLAIRFMEHALAQSGNPDFKHFWEVRKLCLDFFKEPVNPATRATLWAKYSELSKEARRLKEILDEQTAFAVEQIDITITVLEQEVVQYQEHLNKVAEVQFPPTSKAFANHIANYQKLQRQLNLFNAHASRINLLRKELMKTEMRVRQKNRFFQRLSEVGDKVFPLRKEWIKEISQNFIADIDAFVAAHFPLSSKQGQPYHLLREEIKSLQGIAKILTLNTHAFNQTRLKLSACWDQIRQEEKEHKKEVTQHRNQSKERLQELLKHLEEIRTQYAEQKKSVHDTELALEEMIVKLRRQDLMRDDQKQLRQEIDRLRKEVDQALHAQKHAKEKEHQEAQRQRQEALSTLQQELHDLQQQASTLELEILQNKLEEATLKITDLSLSRNERHEFERLIKTLKDSVIERQESSISLSDDEQQALNQLYVILEQRQERRKEVKQALEALRQASGQAGLDFEQALLHNEKINAERERLEKINQAVEEIEEKIHEIRGR